MTIHERKRLGALVVGKSVAQGNWQLNVLPAYVEAGREYEESFLVALFDHGKWTPTGFTIAGTRPLLSEIGSVLSRHGIKYQMRPAHLTVPIQDADSIKAIRLLLVDRRTLSLILAYRSQFKQQALSAA